MIIQDIINFVESNVGFSVHFSPRHGNAGANCLAAEAFKEVCPLGWVSQPSLSLLNILTDDFQKSCDTSPSISSQRSGVDWLMLSTTIGCAFFLYAFPLIFITV